MAHPPLAGRRILLPARWSDYLANALVAAGAEVEEVQLLERRPTSSSALEALPGRIRAGDIDWLVITSAFTPTALDALGHPLGELCHPGLRLAAVGPASARAVRETSGRMPLQPTGTGGAALAAVFPEGAGTVVVPGAARQSPALRRGLQAKGWQVEELGVYRTFPVAEVDPALLARWRTGCYDALLATSPSVVRAAAVLGPGPLVAIGESTAAALSGAGVRPPVARSANPADVVAALAAFLPRAT